MRGWCPLTQIPVRAEARSASEMVTQLLYGESYAVLEEQPEWLKIRSDFDGYEGWISRSSFSPMRSQVPTRVQQELFSILPLGEEVVISSMGSEVPPMLLSEWEEDDPLTLAQRFLGVPYLWGGRTFAGIDCSGLIQVVFKVLGKALPRDAAEQVKMGRAIRFDERMAGDLAFFESDLHRVTHVGILLDPDHLIHAHGKVRQDRLDRKGIYNEEREAYTHKLHSIRRIA